MLCGEEWGDVLCGEEWGDVLCGEEWVMCCVVRSG